MIKHFDSTAKAIYKYFSFKGKTLIKLCVRGQADGILILRVNHVSVDIPLSIHDKIWKTVSAELEYTGTGALEFSFSGKGSLDIKEFIFSI